jgi:hypothetical protein
MIDESAKIGELHLFRLSDGAHWKVPKPAAIEPGSALHVSDDEVWYTGLRDRVMSTVVRQRLDALIEVE